MGRDLPTTDASGALAAAYVQHLPAIVRYLARRLGDGAAEDAAAEVFLRALRAGREGQDITLPWLYGVATNVIHEQRRRERRRLKALQRIASLDRPAYAQHDLHAVALDPDLIAAVRRLPEADREALLLVAWGELTYDQTAEALGVPIGTVRSRIARARSRLQDAAPGRWALTEPSFPLPETVNV